MSTQVEDSATAVAISVPVPTTTDAAAPGRIPPQDINAEKSLIGAILISESVFPDCLERVKYTDFYSPEHSEIYHAMTVLYESHRSIDLLTVTSELKARNTLKTVGGAPYLAELTNFVPTATHAAAYADLIAAASTRRRLIQASTEIAEKAYDSTDSVESIVGAAEKSLFEVSDQTIKSEYAALDTLLVDAYDRIEMLHKNRGALRGLKTGFRDLDKKTAGLQPGDLIIVGARPAMGKTTFAQNIAYNAATINNKGVLFFSMEMASSEIVDRMISDVSGIDNWKIRTGNVSDEDFAKIGDALGEMDQVPLYIDDTSSLNILELRNKARRAAHDHELGLIIIDYLQLINGNDSNYKGNRVLEVAEISRGLKTLARELEIPVIALAQLSRSVTGRDDPRPVLSDLRDSGSIEQDADLVMMLHRVDYYHHEEDYEPTNITELIVAKHRHGPVGTIKLYFHPELLRFMTLDTEHEE